MTALSLLGQAVRAQCPRAVPSPEARAIAFENVHKRKQGINPIVARKH